MSLVMKQHELKVGVRVVKHGILTCRCIVGDSEGNRMYPVPFAGYETIPG